MSLTEHNAAFSGRNIELHRMDRERPGARTDEASIREAGNQEISIHTGLRVPGIELLLDFRLADFNFLLRSLLTFRVGGTILRRGLTRGRAKEAEGLRVTEARGSKPDRIRARLDNLTNPAAPQTRACRIRVEDATANP